MFVIVYFNKMLALGYQKALQIHFLSKGINDTLCFPAQLLIPKYIPILILNHYLKIMRT